VSNAERLREHPSDDLLRVAAEVVAFAKQVGSPEYPYAYRYYDTGDENVMLEVRGFCDRERRNVDFTVVDRAGRPLVDDRAPDEGPFLVTHDIDEVEPQPKRWWGRKRGS